MDDQLTLSYAQILADYLKTGEEACLYQAAEFGKGLLKQGIGHETILEMHFKTLERINKDNKIYPKETIDKSLAVLMEGVMAYAMAYQEYLDSRTEGYLAEIRGLNRKLNENLIRVSALHETQSVINSIMGMSLQNIPLDELLRRTLELILSVPRLATELKGSIFLVADDPGSLVMKVQIGLEEPVQKQCARVQLGRCLCGQAALTGEIQFADRLDDRHELTYEGIGPHGHYCIPILFAGRTLGIICLYLREGYRRNQREDELLGGIANTVAGVIVRKEMEEALQREKDRFRVLVEKSPLGVALLGKDGDYHYVNPRFTEIFGYTLEDIPTGREWFRKAHPDREYRNQVVSDWITYLKESKPGEAKPRTLNVICKDDSEKAIRFLPVMMESGDYFVTYEDTTEYRKIEVQLRHAQKMESVGRLAGGVAHDLNNLLTPIIAYAALVLMELEKDNPLYGDIKEIEKAGQRAESLVRQLLAFSRKQVLAPQVLDLNVVVADIEKMLRRVIREDIDLETILEPEPDRVRVDPGQIEQVIMNLAVNARDAMLRGGKLTIETANVDLDEEYARRHGVDIKPGPYVMLAMSDTGIGMDEETQSQIFEPFFTTKEEGKGTGLGLSTVYGIVKQSDGYIWVYSEPGRGASFKIYLPRVEEEVELEQKRPASEELSRGSETVLLVEDNDGVRDLALSILARYGYNVLEAQNGEEALKVAGRHEGPIHLMLTDVVMPGMSARGLAERVHSLRPEMKVVYMSGYTDNAIVHHGILEAGVKFIQKPFSPITLVRKVRDVLDQKIGD